MSGALAERVFASKIAKVGFTDVTVLSRRPFGLADAEGYPLFTPGLIDLMRRLAPRAQQGEVAVAVTVTARTPAPDRDGVQ